MNLGYALYYVLSNDAQVASVVSTRIYPDAIPRYSVLPAITYTVNNVAVTETKDTTTKWDDVDLTISLFTLTRASGELLSNYVREAMDRKYGIKGADVWITANHRGESWDYLDDGTRDESTTKSRGVCVTNINFRVVVTDASDYAPSVGPLTSSFIRYGSGTLTLTAGSNTFTHSKGSNLKTLAVADSSDEYQYMVNWINDSINAAIIEWVGATLTNATIKYTY